MSIAVKNFDLTHVLTFNIEHAIRRVGINVHLCRHVAHVMRTKVQYEWFIRSTHNVVIGIRDVIVGPVFAFSIGQYEGNTFFLFTKN